MDLYTFPIARYRFIFQVTEPILLPEYAGSTLRGGFGRALRKISCMTKQDNCKSCPLYRTCPYPSIFETPPPENHQLQKFSQVPNGYIIEPPKWGEKLYQVGEELAFDMVLFGKLLHQLPLIAFAWQRAFEYQIAQGKGKLVDILHNHESILLQGQLQEHSSQIQIPNELPDKMALEIITPLRLQDNGTPLSPQNMTKTRFLLSLAKRISLLNEFHSTPIDLNFEKLSEEISQIQDQKQLSWQDWTRYSSRQKQKMKLGGVVGQWQFSNLSQSWRELLYLGQWLHNGKNASFGLGQYKITNL